MDFNQLASIFVAISSAIITYLLSNWIAIAALSISLITLRRNSFRLDVDIEQKARWIKAILLDDGSSIVNDNGMLVTNIKIINPSNFDIGFFDLKIFDINTNRELQPYRGDQFTSLNDLTDRKPIAYFDLSNSANWVNLPHAPHGLIKARVLTSIDIIISPETEINEVYVVFKIAKYRKRFFKIKRGYINSPYEQFSQLVQVEQSLKPDYDQFQDLQHIE